MADTPAAHPWLRVHFLGGFEIWRFDSPVGLETKKSCALFAYLLMNPRPQPRDRLSGLLWGDLPDESARRNLRHALWDLRTRLTPPGGASPILTDGEMVSFDRQTAYWLDVDTFQRMLEHTLHAQPLRLDDPAVLSELQCAADLYNGDFLESLALKDAPAWDEWVLSERERLRSLALQAYETLTETHMASGNFGSAEHAAQKLLLLDPWRESAHRRLMLLLALTDQRSQALAQYETCRRILRQELGVEPEPETRTLYDQIRSGTPIHVERMARRRAAHLPAQPDAFIGRENELAEVEALLDAPGCRLVTFIGPGGVGKTRLALQVGAKKTGAFAGGVYFVSLAPISRPQDLLFTLADTIQLSLDGRRDPKAQLLDALGELKQPVLFILDNFEHLLSEGSLVAELLSASAYLKIIVTSRTVLRLRGEKEVAVSPLALPDLKALPPLEDLARTDAVALFVDRARQVDLHFTLTPANAAAVARICACLDGLPLAIELAAARSKVLPPAALLERLTDRESRAALHILTGGPRDQPDRQRTLRNTIAWSYNLIEPHEQRLFARLGAFAGGCSLEAAEHVCADGGAAPEETLNALASLLDKSMLRRVDGVEGETRFTMLETIREFARDQLTALGEFEPIRRRLADYFLALARQAEPELKGPRQTYWLRRLEGETGNLHAALQGCLDRQDAPLGLALAGALWRYWYARGDLVEGRRWLTRMLALPIPESLDVSLRARALNGAGVLARNQGDSGVALGLFEQSLELYRQVDDGEAIAEVLGSLGATLHDRGEYVQARDFFEQCLALHEKLGNRWGMAMAQSNLATNLIDCQLDLPRAQQLLEKSLAIRRTLGDKTGMAYTLNNLGVARLSLGNLPGALESCAESLALFRELGNKVGIVVALNSLGQISWDRGEPGLSAAMYRECLSLCQETGDKEDAAIALEGLAHVAQSAGLAERALRLLAAAERLRNEIGLPLYPDESARHDDLIATLRAALPAPTFDASWSAGLTLPFAEAIEYGLE